MSTPWDRCSGWSVDPRPVPDEFSADYLHRFPLDVLLEAARGGIGDPVAGFECRDCGTVYPSAFAADVCCME